MRAGNRPEDQNQHDKDRPGRQGVAQQGESDVAARKLRRHDAGADDGCQQEGGSQAFGQEAAGESFSHGSAPILRAMRRAFACGDVAQAVH